MSTSAAIVIATTGRSELVPLMLSQIDAQTIRPARVIFSAHQETDIGVPPQVNLAVDYIYGPAGSSTQRNAAISRLGDECDIVIFWDDDFVPSRYWVERALKIFERADVIALTGTVLWDGGLTQGTTWSIGLEKVNSQDRACHAGGSFAPALRENSRLYGCNMAVRRTALSTTRFDERLVLYGWLEDRDLSFRLARSGKVVKTADLWGVHLGIKRGRISGNRLGYSQVVNPCYLYIKGTMSGSHAIRSIIRPLAANSLKSFFPEEYIDRRGRLKGNLMGLWELLWHRKNCRPERAAKL